MLSLSLILITLNLMQVSTYRFVLVLEPWRLH